MVQMWLPARELVGCVLSLGFGAVSIDPNRISKECGDMIGDELVSNYIIRGRRLTQMPVLTLLQFFAATRCWWVEDFAMYSQWSAWDVVFAISCFGAILLRATAMLMLGRLFSFRIAIRDNHR